jgi:hypothetical protein
MGRVLARHHRELGSGQIQEIPPYALPRVRALLHETRERTSDVLTIVAPLLIGGSVVLALPNHIGADRVVNTVLAPVTGWWLGLPVALGVPILFGVMRKELSLLMIYQALGTFEVGTVLDWVQIMTLQLFLTFYIPCISTFAAMHYSRCCGRSVSRWRSAARCACCCRVRGGSPRESSRAIGQFRPESIRLLGGRMFTTSVAPSFRGASAIGWLVCRGILPEGNGKRVKLQRDWNPLPPWEWQCSKSQSGGQGHAA